MSAPGNLVTIFGNLLTTFDFETSFQKFGTKGLQTDATLFRIGVSPTVTVLLVLAFITELQMQTWPDIKKLLATATYWSQTQLWIGCTRLGSYSAKGRVSAF